MSSEAGPASSVAAPAGRGALLDSLSRRFLEISASMLEAMFAACDDYFFDVASRARSNQDQTLFFESLRMIRKGKSAVIAAYQHRLEVDFAFIANRVVDKRAPQGGGQSWSQPDSLELIAEEQIEKDAAITDMATRARNEWQEELFQLHERMLAIAPRRFEERNSPFDPGRITRAFVRACEPLDIELKVLKLLCRQFERHVLNELDTLYQPLNQLLVDAGVLPGRVPLSRRKVKKYELPPERENKPKPEPQPSTGKWDGGDANGGIPDTDPEMRELAGLLRRMRSGGIRLPMFPEVPAAEAGPPIPRDELISLLSDAQIQAVVPEDSGEPQPLDIRRAIEAIIASRGQLRVGQADEDIINVVAMFFDLILDDRNLPLEIQALVSRLQLPILKVALRDRTFFTERKHPARQLINEIARTSIGWETSSKDTQDGLYIRITELVEEVLRNSSDHADIFEKCLSDLMGFIDRNEQRAAKIERRTSERAQAEARTAKARDMVRHVLQERLEGLQLPTVISAFLVEDWQQVLQLVFLREGKDSPEWIDAVQIVDDLVWSVQTHEDEKSRARLERLLPDLYQRIENGLQHTQSHSEQARARIDVIREVHHKLEAAPATDSPPVDIAPLSPVQQAQIAPTGITDEKSWRDMTAVERQKVQYEALMYEYLKRVDEFTVGAWLEYDDLRRAVTRRCKLATRIDETQTFIFVNRLGMAVFEKPRKAFAYDLQMGHARPIEDAPLFDRTIERISANLRKLAGEG